MAKYSIAWMPGDGIGKDVMDAARLVLDAMKFDAEYVPCEIGWDFWCKEGNALPERTVAALPKTTCALFGAITSKPQDDAIKELAPELKDKKLSYFSPIVKLRQMFNLHTNMRPCKSYAGNPLNYRGTLQSNPGGAEVPIDQVVFRENTEGMYGGVEFHPLPEAVYTALCANAKMKPWKDKGFENIALSTRIVSKQGCSNICRQAFEYAKKTGRKRVTLVEKPNVLRETGGMMTRIFRAMANEYPGITTPSACGCSRTRRTTRCWWPRTCSATSSATCAPGWSAGWGSPRRPTWATSTPCSSRRTAPRPSTPASTRSTRLPCC
jgi:3-isopropylmalate dehydrogenase